MAYPSDLKRGRGCPFCSNKRVLKGYNDLLTTHPDLCKELVDSELMHSLTHGSRKKIEWVCPVGHKWLATPNDRTNKGSGCPYCSGAKVAAGFNSFGDKHPILVQEMVDPSLAYLFTEKSSQIVEWRCQDGHVWSATFYTRANGSGCKTCSVRGGRESTRARGASRLNPITLMLQGQWHEDNPPLEKFSMGSDSIVKWKCLAGHVTQKSVRAYVKFGCSDCSEWGTSRAEKSFADEVEAAGYKIIRNDRKIIAPMELDVFIPRLMTGIEFNGEYWHQDEARETRKMALCKENSVDLIVVWYSDWMKSPGDVMKHVKARLDDIATSRGAFENTGL